MATRHELRKAGEDFRARVGHIARRPPGVAAARQVPGMEHYSNESLFGAAWARPGLDLRYRAMGSLTLLTTLQRLQQLRSYTHTSLEIGLTTNEVEETLVMASMFAGQPATMNALEVVQGVFKDRGVDVPSFNVPEVTLEEAERRGGVILEMMGGGAEWGLDATKALVPDLHALFLRYPLGELFDRPILSVKERLLCTITSATVLRLRGPLAGFIRAGLKAGWTQKDILEIIMQAAGYGGYFSAIEAVGVAQEAFRK